LVINKLNVRSIKFCPLCGTLYKTKNEFGAIVCENQCDTAWKEVEGSALGDTCWGTYTLYFSS
jgi:hypothetical protein